MKLAASLVSALAGILNGRPSKFVYKKHSIGSRSRIPRDDTYRMQSAIDKRKRKNEVRRLNWTGVR